MGILGSEEVLFGSGATLLRGELTRSSGHKRAAVLFLHPHPLYGGGMNDRVIVTLESTLLTLGFDSLRFGFRGSVTTPKGYAGVAGALEDAEAARDALTEKLSPERVVYVGYSFGGSVALGLAARLPPAALVTLSASAALAQEGGFGLNELSSIECPTLLLHGSDDRMIPLGDVNALMRAIGPSANSKILEDGDHFYTRTLGAASEAVSAFLADTLGV